MLNLICGLEHRGSRGGSRVCEANGLPTVGEAAAAAAGKVRGAGPCGGCRIVLMRAPRPHSPPATETQLFAFSSRRRRLAGGREAQASGRAGGTGRRLGALGGRRRSGNTSEVAVPRLLDSGVGVVEAPSGTVPGSSASRSSAQLWFLSLYGDQLDVHSSSRRRRASTWTCPRASR